MPKRGVSRRGFLALGAASAASLVSSSSAVAAAGPASAVGAASAGAASAGAASAGAASAGEELAVAGELVVSPLSRGVIADAGLLLRLAELARRMGALLHSPVPLGTPLHFCGQPLAIVLAPERQVARAAALRLRDELAQALAISPPPLLTLAAAVADARSPRLASQHYDAAVGQAESVFAGAVCRLKQVYHLAARLPSYAAPLSVTVGAQLPLPRLVLSHPHEAALRESLSAWAKLPADWFALDVASPDGEPALFAVLAKLAWSASSKLRRPVELILSPEQARILGGQRPEVIQTLSLGADRSGRLRALLYRVLNASPLAGDFVEPCGLAAWPYAPEHLARQHQIAPLSIGPVAAGPAAGYVAGSFAIESALDELAVLLKLDPLRLRLENLGEAPAGSGQLPAPNPLQKDLLQKALLLGGERLQWSQRTDTPGQKRDGAHRIGYGMAIGHLPLANHRDPTAVVGVAHFVQLRVPALQPAFQVLRHVVVLAGLGHKHPRDRLATRVRRALWSSWDNAFAAPPQYDAKTGALLPAPISRPPGFSDDAITIEYVEPNASPVPAESPTLAEVEALAGCGAAAALANALYNATGYRQRRNPFDLSLLARPTPLL